MGRAFKQGLKRLAKDARNQSSKRKKLTNLLKKQCDCLGDCKCDCENGTLQVMAGQGRAATGASVLPATNWPNKTPKIGGHYETRLTGRQSDEGEIEIETTHSPRGQAAGSARTIAATYDKYRKDF